ncbi:hypothetical protein BLA60_34805 [Actinophytocola xinjiangensis]|uniref:Uncharacterized protein n=1 Tax=Actinophytocola xinjiangensis TaxID=485602 RepID=A0A7Z1AUJ8_9PSEU|nr:hypothetical protein [Actinophytocola xinjiangensis]OLF05687.1 hypothetical protein BLA60_34805 [Actinophytocola xinjiangensis]
MTDGTLRTGTRLRSQVCDTEIIVVRAEGVDRLHCGGRPMVALDADRAGGSPESGLDTGTQLGKRYGRTGDGRVEVLVTRAGAGTLSVGDDVLPVLAAKPLPSSD